MAACTTTDPIRRRPGDESDATRGGSSGGAPPSSSSSSSWPPFNPFLRHPTSTLAKLRMILTGSILLPLRIIGAILTLTAALVWCTIASLGCDTSQPYSPLRRRILLGGCRLFARTLLFFYGYVWITESYEINDPAERADQPNPAIVVCNHVGFAELLYLASYDGCCFVSKEANRALPVIGRVSEIMQSIFVDRGEGGSSSTHSANSRTSSGGGGGGSTTARILERARSPPGTWPPLALCPEGTTTTGHCLISFATGAFRAGLPVQPVVMRMPFSPGYGYDPSFCCANIVTHILCLMTQPRNYLDVRHLAVYVPSDAEKADARLYANNVRAKMAQALEVETYELTWADKLRFETTQGKRELGRRLLTERNGGVEPSMPVFGEDAFGNALVGKGDKVKVT